MLQVTKSLWCWMACAEFMLRNKGILGTCSSPSKFETGPTS